jgi:hypothetical protein
MIPLFNVGQIVYRVFDHTIQEGIVVSITKCDYDSQGNRSYYEYCAKFGAGTFERQTFPWKFLRIS